MTSRGTRILAGSLLVAHGLTEERAETILRAFTAADLDIVKREPVVEPNPGPKAEKPNERVEQLRQIVYRVKNAPIIATEHEEHEA